MYKSNLEYLEEVFPGGTFNLSQPVREPEVDDLIDLNPTKEDRFDDEEEEGEEGPQSKKKQRKQKRKNPNDKFLHALVGDSNFKRYEEHLSGVVYRKATCFNNHGSSGGLSDALNFVVHLKNVKIVIISALQNIVNDEGYPNWKKTVTKYVLTISTAAIKRPEVQFIVLGPFLRTQKYNHGPILKPMLEQLQTEFDPVKNVLVDSDFQVSSGDLLRDGVHLRPRSEGRLFAHLKSLFATNRNVEEQGQANLHRSVPFQKSGHRDLRAFLNRRTAPLIPPPQHLSRQSRVVERQYSPGVCHSHSGNQLVERHDSLGVCHSHSNRRSLERCHSPGVHCSRPASRERSRSPLVKKIEKLDEGFREMFGWFPDQSIYFEHRKRTAAQNESLSRRSSLIPRPEPTMDLFPRRRSVKERLGKR